MSARGSAAVALLLAAATLVVATAVGQGGTSLEALVTPPTPIRAILIGAAVGLGVYLLTRSLARLADAGADDIPGLIRAVRLAFLAVAAFAAAAAWGLAHPLPLIIAAVIAAIDVLETSFLLLVVAARREG